MERNPFRTSLARGLGMRNFEISEGIIFLWNAFHKPQFFKLGGIGTISYLARESVTSTAIYELAGIIGGRPCLVFTHTYETPSCVGFERWLEVELLVWPLLFHLLNVQDEHQAAWEGVGITVRSKSHVWRCRCETKFDDRLGAIVSERAAIACLPPKGLFLFI